LGGRIISALLDKGAEVRVLARAASDKHKVAHLERLGTTVMTLDMASEKKIALVCAGTAYIIAGSE